MTEQGVVKGNSNVVLFPSPSAPRPSGFAFLAGCLGYSSPAQSSIVGRPSVGRYSWMASFAGRPRVVPMSECEGTHAQVTPSGGMGKQAWEAPEERESWEQGRKAG